MKKKQRIKMTCSVCGDVFYLLECQLGRGRGKFCSKTCANNAMKNRSTIFCALCDSPFERTVSEQDIGSDKNQFCSKDCYFDWRSRNRSNNTYPKIGARHMHRIIAEAILKRELSQDEVVHHIDGCKSNVDPKNLAVFPNQGVHTRWHMSKNKSEIDIEKYKLYNLAGEI